MKQARNQLASSFHNLISEISYQTKFFKVTHLSV